MLLSLISLRYMISAALICSGLLSLVQILRWKLIGGYTLGTGLISVIGTSFTFLPIAREVVVSEIQAGRSGMDATASSWEPAWRPP